MLTAAAAIAFIPSTDLERSRQFYVDTLGLVMTGMTPFALVLRTGNGTMLRVMQVEELQVDAIRFYSVAGNVGTR